MIATGILLGPYVFNLLSSHILSISSQLRQMALIIILLKAGLSLDIHDLKKIGRPAILMSCLPATCEIVAFFLFAPWLLRISPIEEPLWVVYWQLFLRQLSFLEWFILWKQTAEQKKEYRNLLWQVLPVMMFL